eukprot:CAMPEP_0182452494 /NCGR_PEP_ID=MMETSP1172-20130603/44280_1 /TAXON_ID=708627 /ORGANISM="Timspurckia oligopyrenoides, Strain CCMP3278" /LENGTH=218 /DNA_ID=CAMNT_0024650329 /DNA_START=31 /DNA_END=687 /DNA_ORIENTATION=+
MAFIASSGFGGARLGLKSATRPSQISMMAEEAARAAPAPPPKSASVPFLSKPVNLDGSLAGDVGFDPLGFSNYLSLKYLRESELKHGRICMLAALGFLVQDIIRLPGEPFKAKLSVDAIYKVPSEGLWQIFIAIGILEFIGHKGKMTYMDMKNDSPATAGAMGFDPLNLGKNPESLKRYALAEVKNGRLAMIAVGGFIHQMWVTKQTVLGQLVNFKPL